MTRFAFLCALLLAAVACGTEPPPPPAVPEPVDNDPLNQLDIRFLRDTAKEVMRELVAALPDRERQLMEPIPLAIEDEPGAVNAFAACIRGEAKMAVTDELLRIMAQLARARATDDHFGTKKFDGYMTFLEGAVKPDQPVPQPPASFFERTQDIDGRKVARQHQLFEEELAFVMGHEIAHHYLGHTGCVGTPHPLIRLGNVLSGRIPIFNQPFELAADTQGTRNLLNAGARRTSYKWTEGGGMMMLTFFSSLEKVKANDSFLFAFFLTHPPSGVRLPVVQQEAERWRRSQPRPPMPAR